MQSKNIRQNKESILSVGIGVIAYSRPDHLKKLFSSLRDQGVQNFSVFVDGSDDYSIRKKQEKIFELINKIDWAKVKLIVRPKNLGLRRSIITSVTEILSEYESVILLEDDTIPKPGFFEYMVKVLNDYRQYPHIRGVCGYQIPTLFTNTSHINSYCLSRFIPWGWGTWRDRWLDYETNIHTLINKVLESGIKDELPEDIKTYIGNDPSFLDSNEVWSINWSLIHYLTNTYSVFPSRSLISNIGFDGTGVHCAETNEFDINDNNNLVNEINIEEKPEFNSKYDGIVNAYLEKSWSKTTTKIEKIYTSKTLLKSELETNIRNCILSTKIIDIHTHLFPPEHTEFHKSGMIELLTYHHLTTEVISVSNISPKSFFEFSKYEQAKFVWDQLFINKTPFSEATKGIITILSTLGIDSYKLNFKNLLDEIKNKGLDANLIFEIMNIKHVIMTNDPFNEKEWSLFNLKTWDRDKYRASIRLDDVFFNKKNQFYIDEKNNMSSILKVSFKDFLDHITSKVNPEYFALSLDGHGLRNILKNPLFLEVLLTHLVDNQIPLSLMIGVKRGVNKSLGLGGDGLGTDGLEELEIIASANSKLKILVTHLSNTVQHRIAILSRKFPNITIFGFWWFNNQPSLIKKDLKMRFDLLGFDQILQHSDARVHEQIIYKWKHFQEILVAELLERYNFLIDSGWNPSEKDVEKDIKNLFIDFPKSLLLK